MANWTFSTPNNQGFDATSAIWTGTEMIVWGGRFQGYPLPTELKNVGGRYNPTTNSWVNVSNTNAPTVRRNHVSVWTGSKMIVWGGYSANYTNTPITTGGVYDPVADSWTNMSNTNAPTTFVPQTAIWTGTEMIVFDDSPGLAKYLYRYNPSTNVWTTSPPFYPLSGSSGFTTIFTGKKIYYYGSGYNGFSIYDVATNTFDIPSVTLPAGYPVLTIPFADHTAVWTGLEMIVFGNSYGHILRPNFSVNATPTPYFFYKKN
jgi:N-acetylneuraminic acid mutarotase